MSRRWGPRGFESISAYQVLNKVLLLCARAYNNSPAGV